MKTTVTDAAVAEYAARIRSGTPLGKLFPAKMSECDFTASQREVIRKARLDRKAALKTTPAGPRSSVPRVEAPAPVAPQPPTSAAAESKSKGIPKLRRLLYLQSDRCFFCGEPLALDEASIEHLHPLSRGGQRTEDNEVVCHASLNEVLGALELKRKFELVLRANGRFVCPKR